MKDLIESVISADPLEVRSGWLLLINELERLTNRSVLMWTRMSGDNQTLGPKFLTALGAGFAVTLESVLPPTQSDLPVLFELSIHSEQGNRLAFVEDGELDDTGGSQDAYFLMLKIYDTIR